MVRRGNKPYKIRDGKVYMRLTWLDASGKRHELMRRAENITQAREMADKARRELEERGEPALKGDHITFEELARFYAEQKVKPAEYHNGRKIAGLKSYKTPKASLQTLADYFGKRRIKTITHAEIEAFQQKRLKTPTPRGQPRALASVNRELELLRAVLRFAVRQGWLARSPFEMGAPLISKASETRRERVLTLEEEARLLSVCTGRRAHLRPLLITALDTALRRGELLKLTWADLDFAHKLIRVRATTTKTETGRTVGMTPRVEQELRALRKPTARPEDLVFGLTDNCKNSFRAACRAAGIENFRFHDTRHTATTRMVQSGLPAHLIMKITGHTQPITFMRYVNVNEQTAREAAETLARFYANRAPGASGGEP